jgi:protein SCO1/2
VLINPEGHFHGFFKVPHDPEKMALTFRSVFAAWP